MTFLEWILERLRKNNHKEEENRPFLEVEVPYIEPEEEEKEKDDPKRVVIIDL